MSQNYRLYLVSSQGTKVNGNVYDVIFNNVVIPMLYVEDDLEPKNWHVRVESFVSTQLSGVTPYTVLSDLPILGAYSSAAVNRMPLHAGMSESFFAPVATQDAGFVLSSAPGRLFSGSSIRIQVADLNGSVLANENGEVWALSLVVYQHTP